MPLYLGLINLVQLWFLLGEMREWSHPNVGGKGSLYNWVEVFHIKVDDNKSSKILTWRGTYPFHIPMVLPLRPSSVSSCHGCPVCYLMASMGWDVYPSTKHMQSCRHPHPVHVTWNLYPSSVDAPADVHGRSHSFPLIHPMEVFLAWCWVIARPSCGIVLLSLPLGVGWSGSGLVHLSLAHTHT